MMILSLCALQYKQLTSSKRKEVGRQGRGVVLLLALLLFVIPSGVCDHLGVGCSGISSSGAQESHSGRLEV